MVVDNILSLLTISFLLNNTTDNQGDHCVVAFNLLATQPVIETGNQVLVPSAICQEMGFMVGRSMVALGGMYAVPSLRLQMRSTVGG